MSQGANQEQSTDDRLIRIGDVVTTLVLMAVFAAAYWTARSWPPHAALLTKVVSGFGVATGAARLLGLGGLAFRSPKARDRAELSLGAATDVLVLGDDDEEVRDLEQLFAGVSGETWVRNLTWIAGFLGLTYVLGLVVTLPVFALLYLRFSGGISWLHSAVYAVVSLVLVWGLFAQALAVPMPSGVL